MIAEENLPCLVFLQNAWSTKHKRNWPIVSWRRALAQSRSGQRLREIFPDDWHRIIFANCTAEVADKPSGLCEPDIDYIRNMIADTDPAILVACGRVARAAVIRVWPGPTLFLPHPAWRLLPSHLLERARMILSKPFCETVDLYSGNGKEITLP